MTTLHPASSYGRPVIVAEGEPVGPLDVALSGWQIVEATPGERADLLRGGFDLVDAPR